MNQDAPLLQCRECEGWYNEAFFSPMGFGKSSCRKQYLRPRCKACRLTRRTEEKAGSGRYIVKARSTISQHAYKFIRKGIIRSKKELVVEFGWRVPKMAHDIEHAASNGCPYCRIPFASMPNFPSAVTIDIVDPEKRPYYSTNIRWVCITCNRAKANMSPDQWAVHLRCWEKWREQQEVLRQKPQAILWIQGMLFAILRNLW